MFYNQCHNQFVLPVDVYL